MGSISAASVEDLSTSGCWALLRNMPIGRIALRNVGGIEIFPINFVVDGGSILFRTALGTKLELIGDGATCTFEADEIDAAASLVWSVVLKGTVRPIHGHDSIVATFDMEVPTWQAGHKPTYVRITPTSITGRRFPVDAS